MRLKHQIRSAVTNLQYLCGSTFPEIGRSIRSARVDQKYHQRREKILRRLLCQCPWWVDGHLHLGLLQIEMAEGQLRDGRMVPAERFKLLETMRISAEAVEKLAGPGDQALPTAEVLEARYLKAMERYFSGDYEASFVQLSELNQPKFRVQLRRAVWLGVLEFAGYAAIKVRSLGQAQALFRAMPAAFRSHDINRLLQAADAGTAILEP